jgi:hypothetical protein
MGHDPDLIPEPEMQHHDLVNLYATVYVSPIELNQEHGVVETPHVPVVRFAAAVQTADGKLFGIVIINLDPRPMFAKLRMSISQDSRIHLVGEDGDYLLHPQPAREFGFDLGQRFRWQDEFPGLVAALGSAESGVAVVDNARGERVAAGLATVAWPEGLRVKLIETVPYARIIAPALAIRQSGLMVGFGAVVCALVLAVLIARSLTRPLVSASARRLVRTSKPFLSGK